MDATNAAHAMDVLTRAVMGGGLVGVVVVAFSYLSNR